jgi:hypothetical protein
MGVLAIHRLGARPPPTAGQTKAQAKAELEARQARAEVVQILLGRSGDEIHGLGGVIPCALARRQQHAQRSHVEGHEHRPYPQPGQRRTAMPSVTNAHSTTAPSAQAVAAKEGTNHTPPTATAASMPLHAMTSRVCASSAGGKGSTERLDERERQQRERLSRSGCESATPQEPARQPRRMGERKWHPGRARTCSRRAAASMANAPGFMARSWRSRRSWGAIEQSSPNTIKNGSERLEAGSSARATLSRRPSPPP